MRLARRIEEHGLAKGSEAFSLPRKKHLPDGLRTRRAARLACLKNGQSGPAQSLRQEGSLGGFTAAFTALKRNEFARFHVL